MAKQPIDVVKEYLEERAKTDLFRHMVREATLHFDFIHAVRIANRRGYIVEDSSLWIDMLRMAQRLGLDTHNPDIVCPQDLVAAHDRILARYARKEKGKELMKNIDKARASEKEYRKNKGKFFDTNISDGDINISVIPSVVGILQEGKERHQCQIRQDI